MSPLCIVVGFKVIASQASVFFAVLVQSCSRRHFAYMAERAEHVRGGFAGHINRRHMRHTSPCRVRACRIAYTGDTIRAVAAADSL